MPKSSSVMGPSLKLLCLIQKLFSDSYLRVTCWHIGTLQCKLVRNFGAYHVIAIMHEKNLARRQVTCHGTLARKEIWHVACDGTLARK